MSDELKNHAPMASAPIPHEAPTDESAPPFDPGCRSSILEKTTPQLRLVQPNGPFKPSRPSKSQPVAPPRREISTSISIHGALFRTVSLCFTKQKNAPATFRWIPFVSTKKTGRLSAPICVHLWMIPYSHFRIRPAVRSRVEGSWSSKRRLC
jgi:hypothetical protein